jgi:hypothetical protein
VPFLTGEPAENYVTRPNVRNVRVELSRGHVPDENVLVNVAGVAVNGRFVVIARVDKMEPRFPEPEV